MTDETRAQARHPLEDIAHDGSEDCAYNFGRECDCGAPEELVHRMRNAGYALVPVDPKKRPEGIIK